MELLNAWLIISVFVIYILGILFALIISQYNRVIK